MRDLRMKRRREGVPPMEHRGKRKLLRFVFGRTMILVIMLLLQLLVLVALAISTWLNTVYFLRTVITLYRPALPGSNYPVEKGRRGFCFSLSCVAFAAVNVARYVKTDPEEALSQACDKFARRFRAVEEAAQAQARRLEDMTLAEMDALWDKVKAQEA